MKSGQDITTKSIFEQFKTTILTMTELNAFFKNHPTLIFADDMQMICQPLFKLGIDYFSHVTINAQNEMTANSSNPEYFRYYFEQGYHQSDLHTTRFDIPQRYVHWHFVKREGKAEKLYQSGIEYGLFYVFTIIDHSPTEKNYYHFAARPYKDHMNDFYYQHIDLLEQFVAYYKHSMLLNNRLNRAYKIPYKIKRTEGSHIIQIDSHSSLSLEQIKEYLNTIRPNARAANNLSQLSRRELQCALYLLEGKTSMEIAQLLNLSPRTVEVYFDRLKNRFGSKNKIQLTRHLIEAGILKEFQI